MIYCPETFSCRTHVEEARPEEGADALDDDVEEGLDEADLAPHEQPGRHSRVDVATWGAEFRDFKPNLSKREARKNCN